MESRSPARLSLAREHRHVKNETRPSRQRGGASARPGVRPNSRSSQPPEAEAPSPLPTVEVTATEGGGEGGGAGNGPPESPGEKAGYSAPPIASATKITMPIFDLPISLQTVPEQVIIDQNAITIQDAIENVSGVRSNNNNIEGYVYNIRGFTTFNVFRNGLLVGTAIPQGYDTANLQAIEVLKGPASFLFGRADPGGVINRVTKKPLDTPYNSITRRFGSFNLWRTVWDFTGPVQVPELDKVRKLPFFRQLSKWRHIHRLHHQPKHLPGAFAHLADRPLHQTDRRGGVQSPERAKQCRPTCRRLQSAWRRQAG